MTGQTDNGAATRLPLLDGLRGIAALGVLAFHLPGFFHIPQMLPKAYLFVDFFFLLSGFVLTPVIAARRASGVSATAFFVSRIRRFWPLAAVGTVLSALVFSTNPSFPDVFPKLALALAFIPAVFLSHALFPLNVVQWSLFWELVANGAHARWWDRWADRALWMMVVLCGAIHGAAIVLIGTGDIGAHFDYWYLAIPRVAFAYGIGMLVARHFTGAKAVSAPQWFLRGSLPVVAVALLPLTGDALLWVEVGVVLFLFPIAFRWIASAMPEERWHRALSGLGRISFPLYAVHVPLLLGTQLFTYSWQGAVFGTMLVLAVSMLLARVMEPGRGWRAARGQADTASSTPANAA